ncbi:MAG: family 10 glycosylhydrolase [Leptolyngbyaceae cyanobacterium MAG.088]|nr:family 10 glycosylhydrolase [Leptolyngbyaceae cyanobacterium MAG.088]
MVSLRRLGHRFLAGMLAVLCVAMIHHPAQAQVGDLNRYCQLSQVEVDAKETLRQQAASGDAVAIAQYEDLLKRHSDVLRSCRQRQWPRQQATWLRLYPCDLRPGVLDALMDRVVNLGYNEVYVEVFYNGQVLIPKSENRTVWPSVIQQQGYENQDLLADAISVGHKRGLKVYAWMFTMNFGYSYGQRRDRQQVLARNGNGETTSAFASRGGSNNPEEIFVDPYNYQAQGDYARMLQLVLKRKPDGVLFDYIRYPRGIGSNSVVGQVGDLWIYGSAAQNALIQRAQNNKGRELIRQFLTRGYLIEGDLDRVDKQFPNEAEPLWQSRRPSGSTSDAPLSVRRPALQLELWRLSVAHAVQGVIDFLNTVSQPVKQQNIPVGAVFFPTANQPVGTQGYDSRLQHWNRFPKSISWHPMAYSICGNTNCIVQEVQMVLRQNSASNVRPALAGVWGRAINNRPSLEAQMDALQRTVPNIQSISHFAYSWQDPEFDRFRKFCALP